MYLDDFLFLVVFFIGAHLFISFFTLGTVLWPNLLSFKHKRSKYPPTRFNRQRREVAWMADSGQMYYIPWESFHAWITTTTAASDSTFTRQVLLMMGIPDPDKPGNVMVIWQIPVGTEVNGLMQWECIRTFMEEGPDAIPEPRVGKIEREEYYQQREEARRREGNGHYYWQRFKDFYFGKYIAFRFCERVLRQEIGAFPAETEEWSKPLPKKERAKPSEAYKKANAIQKRQYNHGVKLWKG
ncbi:DUF6708 domain-containing protein [Spartinivicinus poritis]|uniref:Uncharacterized protein n=1 Tax=Spartinivicinus poritis TaxID=2994640 RepID=A0ABT5UE17_9GAMM|nr:DUF6708 domain-containing protein [Spartinivicinus sp. A2-2]MDE1464621.1 hypothetical protein [Spartinivicinus sp. A2-2]